MLSRIFQALASSLYLFLFVDRSIDSIYRWRQSTSNGSVSVVIGWGDQVLGGGSETPKTSDRLIGQQKEFDDKQFTPPTFCSYTISSGYFISYKIFIVCLMIIHGSASRQRRAAAIVTDRREEVEVAAGATIGPEQVLTQSLESSIMAVDLVGDHCPKLKCVYLFSPLYWSCLSGLQKGLNDSCLKSSEKCPNLEHIPSLHERKHLKKWLLNIQIFLPLVWPIVLQVYHSNHLHLLDQSRWYLILKSWIQFPPNIWPHLKPWSVYQVSCFDSDSRVLVISVQPAEVSHLLTSV